MRKTLLITVSLLMSSSPQLLAHQHAAASCETKAQPLLTVSDFDGNGKVDGRDISAIARTISKHKYFTIFDRDVDSDVDRNDLLLAARDLGKSSSKHDQQLAKLYNELTALQHANSDSLVAMGFEPSTGSLSGHGAHWINIFSNLPVSGLNVPEDGTSVKGIFYLDNAMPLFNDSSAASGLSSLDYPQPGGAWIYERVQAFAGQPPTIFPHTTDENWHVHGGLCITTQNLGHGPQFQLDQHTSFMECQSLPSLSKTTVNGVKLNTWVNIWMLHAWMFDLNPQGLFANTHPCLDPHAPLESEINGDRVVPPFFLHHGG